MKQARNCGRRSSHLRNLALTSLVLTALPAGGRAESNEADAGAEPSAAETARRGQVIVGGKGAAVTVGDLEDVLAKQPPMLRERYQNPEELKALADNLLRMELIAAEAERRGFGDNPIVRRTVKDSAVQNLLRVEVDEKITPASIQAEEVKAYYDAHQAEFHRPAQRRASQIMVATEEEAARLLEEASEADARRFSQLAKEHSLDGATKLRGGDLGFFPETPTERDPRLPPLHDAVREAAFALKTVGDVTEKPIAVDGQFAIVRLLGERPERHTDLDQAESAIRSRMWRTKRREAVAALIERLRVEQKPKVFAERVDLVSFEGMDKRPTGFAPEPKQIKKPQE